MARIILKYYKYLVLYFLPVFCFISYTLVNVTKKDRVLIRKQLTIPGNKSIAFSNNTKNAQTQLLFEAQL